MKSIFRFLVLVTGIVQINITAQTITSTTSGGHWNEASTWIGGVVPGENNDVVINGPVVTPYITCNNLTINSGGSLEDESSSGRTLTVKGNLVNNGTVKNAYAGLTLAVYGSVTNNGTMIQSGLRFAGSGSQNFSTTQKVSCGTIWKDPSGTINAASDIVIDSVTAVALDYDVLNMGSYKLTKYSRKDIDNAGEIFSGGTLYSNGLLDIGGMFTSDLDGNPTITGSTNLLFGYITVKGNITIGAGKTVQDQPSSGRTVTVKGNLTNNGTISHRHGGLTFSVEGNVINNSVYTAKLRFSGPDNQTFSGTSKFSCSSIWKDPSGTINAASDIVIDSVTAVALDYDVLNMGSYKLTKYSRKDIDNAGEIFSGGTLYSNGLLDIGGMFTSDLDGNPTITGSTNLLFGYITVKGNITIGAGKTVQDQPSAGRTVTVKGNLTNNGTISHRHGGLTLAVEGNVINNSVYTARLRFSGPDNQTFSGTAKYSCSSIWKEPSGIFNAASDIIIDSISTVDLSYDTLNMGSYKLTKISRKDFDNSNDIIYGGTLYSDGEIYHGGKLQSDLDGDFLLTGDVPTLMSYLTVKGNFRVDKNKIVQDEPSAGREFKVYGDLINDGTISNRYAGLGILVYGNIYNNSDININYIRQIANGKSLSVYGLFGNQMRFQNGDQQGNIHVDGFLRVNGEVIIGTDHIFTVPSGGEFLSYGPLTNYSVIYNEGKFEHKDYVSSYYGITLDPVMKIKFNIYDRGSGDSLTVAVMNNQKHPKMSASINRWWSYASNKTLNSFGVELKYDDENLGGQDPNQLEAFLSTDGGETWNKISNPLNTTRDIANKTIKVGSSGYPINYSFGDIILSTGNITNVASISSAVGGRKQIRVGPPNIYTVSYWNNNNYSTDKFFIKLNTNQGVYINGITSKKIGTDTLVSIPIDSLVYDNKSEVILLVQPLGPKEVRSFDVILKAVPGSTLKAMEPITFTAALLWIGGAIVEEYISNTVVEGCYEMWRPVRNDQSLTDASVQALKNSMGKAVTVENGIQGVAKKGAEEILKKTGRVVAWPAMLAKDIFDCLGNTVKGMKDYVNGNFDKQDKELEKVTSWDPNAKEGPTGFGDQGFMATSAPMTYTIFFENKKEATAPAYEIIILDTLDQNVFDVTSVKAGAMSHPMGVFTQTGNILKWQFTAIELVPNANPPEGEGWVKFTVMPKSNLPTGTQLKNMAVITFDLNKPLATNLAVNTLDFDPPVTTVSSYQQVSGRNEIYLAWNIGDGTGAGGKNSMVYLAQGDGPFTLAATTDKNNVTIPVLKNSAYKFYVLSTDNVGNSEQNPQKVYDIVTAIDKPAEIPVSYSLSQNYPNPFNPATVISYSLPEASLVTIKVYDILGREVYTLVNEFKQSGKYEVNWKPELSSGVYIYKLRAGSFTDVKKMLLLK